MRKANKYPMVAQTLPNHLVVKQVIVTLTTKIPLRSAYHHGFPRSQLDAWNLDPRINVVFGIGG